MNRLSSGASLAWQIAAVETDGGGHERIERGHLLIGVLSLEKFREAPPAELGLGPDRHEEIRQEIGRIDEALRRASARSAELRRTLREVLGTGAAARGRRSISRSEGAKLAFLRAAELAAGEEPSSLHLLATLVLEPDTALGRALRACGVDGRALGEAALKEAGSGAPAAGSEPTERVGSPRPGAGPTPELDRYSRDLTKLARERQLGPVIGRRDVLLDIVRTLARSSKNNPLLVGEAGVGKTAIVEGLAIRAAEGKDGAVLAGRRIVELNVGALLGGTQYRGEFEERIAKILEEVKGHPEIVVFIDELHTIVGAGRIGEGGMDAANLLKPALARGDFCCIGATTVDEYSKYIEPEAALERRFARIDVPEPSRDECLEILRGLRKKWQSHHQVTIADTALEAAVDLSIRFDPEHFLPDKAVDLVDKAAARTRVPVLSYLKPTDGPRPPGAPSAMGPPVNARTVAEVLAEKRHLPVELVLSGGRANARLLELEGFLRGRLMGQDEAVARVAERLRLAHAGLQSRRGPLAVFLFLGPTGVGKTELARLLAEFLFGHESAMTRLDMSELMEEHAVAKLIGAPPGYVGHDEEGQLTSALRARPYSVVLLDEVEKAHPRVFDLFLQLFDEGRLTDAKGRTADGKQAIFIMTSNLGNTEAAAVAGFAPGSGPNDSGRYAALGEVRRFFRPELLNRVDEIVVFRTLDPESVRRIVRPMLAALVESVRSQHGVDITVTPEAEAFLAKTGFSEAQGARELGRAVERLVQSPLSGLILSGKLYRHAAWQLVYDEGGIYVLPV
jgi:ATP-dependent Clp protease ATP-binding subunit ClpC